MYNLYCFIGAYVFKVFVDDEILASVFTSFALMSEFESE